MAQEGSDWILVAIWIILWTVDMIQDSLPEGDMVIFIHTIMCRDRQTDRQTR